MFAALFLILVAALVAYANGANDNFKGVATLYGSAMTNFKAALWWANTTTLLGALTAVSFGHRLAWVFGGSGLLPDDIVRFVPFLVPVGFAAAATVLFATRLGLPISTTHALMGSLTGAGILAAPGLFNFSTLATKFLMPLLISPFVAFLVTLVVYPVLSSLRQRLGITRESCGCIGMTACEPETMNGVAAMTTEVPAVKIATLQECKQEYAGSVVGVSAQKLLNMLHFGSAGAVGFARGLNDAPKIAGLAMAGAALPMHQAVLLAAAAMLVGGIMGTRRVAETMSHRITTMNDGQAFTANAVTALLVLLGSLASLPFSTTHVSCGALFGLGAVTAGAHKKMIAGVIASWVTTLPLAASLSALFFMLMKGVLA
ncbi:MAG: inorganic phosphate transporter [Candidatus Sumerlaeia bacterium]